MPRDRQRRGTRDLLPRLGRAKMHGARSKGHPDAGALSLALCVETIGDLLANAATRTTPEAA